MRRVGKLLASRRYNLLPLLRSRPGGFTGSWPCKTCPSCTVCRRFLQQAFCFAAAKVQLFFLPPKKMALNFTFLTFCGHLSDCSVMPEGKVWKEIFVIYIIFIQSATLAPRGACEVPKFLNSLDKKCVGRLLLANERVLSKESGNQGIAPKGACAVPPFPLFLLFLRDNNFSVRGVAAAT